MKFKASQAINQRIQRITTRHLVVGIDIAKENHVAAAVNFRGIQQGRILSFSNDTAGLDDLLSFVQQLQQSLNFKQVIFGVESTGHYFLNLAFALREKGYTVVLVNPAATKRNKENRDNKPSKNDAKDALTIADLVSRGIYADWRVPDPVYRNLRCAVNEREALSKDLTALGNQIQTVIDPIFPEFYRVFGDWTDKRALATLKRLPLPSDILQRNPAEIVEEWRMAGMLRPGGPSGLRIAAQLREAAQSSLGLTVVDETLKRQLRRLLMRYETLQMQLREVDQEIEALMKEVPQEALHPLQQLKFSPWFTAVILANTGDLRNYQHGQQLLALAGLNLSERRSGKYQGQVKLTKRGRRQLRKYLYLAVLMHVQNHPLFKHWHTHNVKILKMKGRTSLFKLIGKAARILVALAHNGEAFEGSKHPMPSAA